MAGSAVEQVQRNTFELDLRRGAQLIVPDDGGVVHFDVALPQQPVTEASAALLSGHFDAGDRQYAARVAAHRERGPVNVDFMEPQLERGQRQPGHGRVDARELEGGLAGRVEHRHLP